MDKTKRLATDLVLDALKQSGIKVVRIPDTQINDYLRVADNTERARYSIEMGPSLFPATLFRSNAEIALDTIKQEKATASHWLAMLTKAGGIKAEEDHWMKLSAWLKEKGNLTLNRQEITEYIANHGIRLQEETFFDTENTSVLQKYQEEMNEYINEARQQGISEAPEDAYEYAFECMCNDYGDDFDQAFGHDHGVLYIYDSDMAYDFLGINTINEVRKQHMTEDLENLKEIAMYCPDIEPWNEEDEIHFGRVGDGRCIAWIRFGETIQHHPYTTEEIKQMREVMPGADQWRKDSSGSVYRPPVINPEYPDAHIELRNGIYWIRDVHGLLFVDHDTLESAVNEYNRYTVP